MYGWSESIQATAMLTDSCGFMMIQGSCHPKFVNDMARVCLLHLLQPASVVVRAWTLRSSSPRAADTTLLSLRPTR